MALTFENGNYVLTYKDHLENKTTIKVQVFGSNLLDIKYVYYGFNDDLIEIIN